MNFSIRKANTTRKILNEEIVYEKPVPRSFRSGTRVLMFHLSCHDLIQFLGVLDIDAELVECQSDLKVISLEQYSRQCDDCIHHWCIDTDGVSDACPQDEPAFDIFGDIPVLQVCRPEYIPEHR